MTSSSPPDHCLLCRITKEFDPKLPEKIIGLSRLWLTLAQKKLVFTRNAREISLLEIMSDEGLEDIEIESRYLAHIDFHAGCLL
ncbi:hypothetical protein Hanom_Chr03g00255371 [Helianthus anomalus]